MSTDETPNAPATMDRREAVREKALRVHAQQTKARTIRRLVLAGIAVVVLASLTVVIVWAVTASASKPQLSPSNMTDDGVRIENIGTSMPDSDALPAPGTTATPTPTATTAPAPTASGESARGVEIAVYVDYLSPGSQQFQLANGTQLAEWVQQGAVTLTYHPVALLTPKSNGTKYSLRAAAAAACVATHEFDRFFAFNQALLERQPAVDSDGFSDRELADIAIAAGADDPKRVRACIEKESFVSWAQGATERALAGPLPGTESVKLTGAPLVIANGVAYTGAADDPKEFAQFVLTLSSNAYYTSTPTPTPTTTSAVTPTPTETPKK